LVKTINLPLKQKKSASQMPESKAKTNTHTSNETQIRTQFKTKNKPDSVL